MFSHFRGGQGTKIYRAGAELVNWWPGTEGVPGLNWFAGSGHLKRIMRYCRGAGQCVACVVRVSRARGECSLASLIRAAPDQHTTQGDGANVIEKGASVACSGSVLGGSGADLECVESRVRKVEHLDGADHGEIRP